MGEGLHTSYPPIPYPISRRDILGMFDLVNMVKQQIKDDGNTKLSTHGTKLTNKTPKYLIK